MIALAPIALVAAILLPSTAAADAHPATVTVDFSHAVYPPLVKKWGGVEHWDPPLDVPQPDGSASAADAMAANRKRETPMVLGVMQLGTTMTKTPSVVLKRLQNGSVVPVLDPARMALRAQRGGASGVLPLLQLDGCPTPTFHINASSVPAPSARYYPMCAYDELDELTAAFANFARALKDADGLPSAWSFWPEPGHTLDSKNNATVQQNFERYLDFYERVAPALREAVPDDVVAGWQLNAANGNGAPESTVFWSSVRAFLAREQRSGRRFPVDYFTVQNYQGDKSASLVSNARAALCMELSDNARARATTSGPPSCSSRFALTPLIFVRFSEHKTVDPNYDHKSGVTALLDELQLTASLPDVAFVLHSKWAAFHDSGDKASGVSPMVTSALAFFRRRMPDFQASVSFSPSWGAGNAQESLSGMAAINETAQCFIVWSRSEETVTADLTLQLARPPPRRKGASLDLLTLGPKNPEFYVYRTVPLPQPPANSVAISAVQFVSHGVVAACLEEEVREDQEATSTSADAAAVVVTRHDVLVPRGHAYDKVPTGMGHWGRFRSTLTVSVADGGGVAVGGVIVRTAASSLRLAFVLHQSSKMGGRHARSSSTIAAAVRLDYLSSNATSVCFAANATTRTTMSCADIWTAGGEAAAAAAAWPSGSMPSTSWRHGQAFMLQPMNQGPTFLSVPLTTGRGSDWRGRRKNLGQDGGEEEAEQRLRVSLILRTSPSSSSSAQEAAAAAATTLQIRLLS